MREPGNLWAQLWGATLPVAAAQQRPLFDAAREAEIVLHQLEVLPPQQLLPQVRTWLGLGLGLCTHALSHLRNHSLTHSLTRLLISPPPHFPQLVACAFELCLSLLRDSHLAPLLPAADHRRTPHSALEP